MSAASAVRATAVTTTKLAAFALAWGLLVAPYFVLGGPGAAPQGGAIDARLAREVVLVASLLAVTALAARLEGPKLGAIGLGRAHLLRDVGVGAGLGAATLAATLAAAWALGSFRWGFEGTFDGGGLARASVALILNAATQELLFRGYVFRLVQRDAGARWAVLLSTALFAAAHAPRLGSLLAAVNLVLVGLAFALALLWSGRLWMPISMHAAWNVLLGPVLGLTVSGRGDLGATWRVGTLSGPALVTGGAFGVEASLGATLALALLVAFLWRPPRA